MFDVTPYQLLADLVLSLHFAVVSFVVGGLASVIVGNLLAWHWVNAFGFRMAHLLAIGIVVAESWMGAVCPLTTLEMWLRTKARTTAYGGSFIEHWVQQLLYFDAPPWVFTLGYTVFGLLVVASWWWFPPKRRGSGRTAGR